MQLPRGLSEAHEKPALHFPFLSPKQEAELPINSDSGFCCSRAWQVQLQWQTGIKPSKKARGGTRDAELQLSQHRRGTAMGFAEEKITSFETEQGPRVWHPSLNGSRAEDLGGARRFYRQSSGTRNFFIQTPLAPSSSVPCALRTASPPGEIYHGKTLHWKRSFQALQVDIQGQSPAQAVQEQGKGRSAGKGPPLQLEMPRTCPAVPTPTTLHRHSSSPAEHPSNAAQGPLGATQDH